MSALASQRCLNHFDREAIARCLECRGFFCRECITEHEGRIVCGNCLQALLAPATDKKRPFLGGIVRPVITSALGLVLAWYCFYTIGRNLLSMPSEFHPETFWSSEWRIGGGGDE
jgi:hypothetical protein